MARKTIKVDYLARVEGEGALHVRLRDGRVDDVQLRIFEPPRFFEAFLRGRGYAEAPDITARICGICPVAYQMSAVHAMEDVCGVRVEGPLRALRRLLYCGEWIESHALHIYMLHAPDFLGYESAIHMARDHPEIVQRGLQLKKAGNEIVALLGGREIHPINVRVGGFYKIPARRELASLAERLQWARDAALETVRWAAGFDFPDCTRDYEFVALRHADEYPMNEGRLVSNKGLDIAVREYDAHFEEAHVAHSNALHARIRGRGAYLVGPLARYSLNFDRLSPVVQEAAREAGLTPVCTNPYQSIVVRSLEVLYACDEALRILAAYEEPESPAVPVAPRAGTGYACTEAPRGSLYHRYRLEDDGTILDARIVPPTSQNQPSIEDDLRGFIPSWVDLPDEALQWRCEQTIRNYDPCISCATHFLRLDVERG
ncbi:MAG: Ni/Fe hydrogenase subunit alpha [Gammaproteobacteria bacterium]|nr:Ni/Fe hydrogenase subunit alpha [Gammaproteobacteria bacterium]